jgi:alkanesulfonate monooxygenase SsuD/methylene tetrahydromethanopterin reductase-like flavin-dependent oxidoreductase (luciferase family)
MVISLDGLSLAGAVAVVAPGRLVPGSIGPGTPIRELPDPTPDFRKPLPGGVHMRLAVALHGGTSASAEALAEEALRTSQTARDAGYSAVVAGQHFLTAPLAYLQPLPLLSRLIPETGDMRLVAGVLLLPLLHPVQLAEELATLDVLSGGRLVVGAGQGYREAEFAAFGVDRADRRAAQLRTLDRMIACWEGAGSGGADNPGGDGAGGGCGPGGAGGAGGGCGDEGPGARPATAPHPPIWYAAGNRRAFARAVERGYTPFVGPQIAGRRLAALLQLAPPGGSIALRRDVLVTDVVGRAAAERALAERAALDGAWGYTGPGGETRTGAGTGTGTEVAGGFPYEVGGGDPYLVGTAEQCRRGMAELARAGVTDLVLRTNWPGLDHRSSLAMLRALAGPVPPPVPSP